jgi:drug/metabolite transporter (DMT)-like permease
MQVSLVSAARLTLPGIPAGSAPVAALVLASLFWGTADVAGKLAMGSIPPVMLAALRFGVAIAIFWPLARRAGGPRVPIRVTAPLGLLGVALTFLLQNLGLDRTSATNASLLQGAAPVMALLLAAVFLGERLVPRRIAAVGAAMAGVAVVTLPGGEGVQAPGLGDLLVIASTVCFAAFVILGRRAFPTYGTLPVLAGMAAWGMALLAPAAAVEWRIVGSPNIEAGSIALVLYLGAGCSALTYALWGYALRHVEAGRAATFDALIPVIGIAAAVLVLREAPLIWHVAGGTLVVLGLWMAVHEPRPAASPAERPATTGWAMARNAAGCLSARLHVVTW